MQIVDRRLNPKSKSLGNRQRFLRRAKAEIREAVKDAIKNRKVSEADGGEKVTIRSKNLREPSFGLGRGVGQRDFVLPGNEQYRVGDAIPKPPQGGGGGKGREGSPDGEGQDEFSFVLSRDEFLDLFFDDLKLPNLIKVKLKDLKVSKPARAGFSADGSPSRLNTVRSMRNSLGRRIALRRPSEEEIKKLEAELVAAEAETPPNVFRVDELKRELAKKLHQRKVIAYLDPVDLRYNRFERVPKPTTQAVMFCLMDASASMTESLKDLAKRFFMLLHLFLTRHYREVHIVFIRHTSTAAVVDEETFFRGTETGGTVISSALEEMLKVVRKIVLAGRLEHLRRAGVRRRQLPRRHAEVHGTAHQRDPADLPVLRLHRDRARRTLLRQPRNTGMVGLFRAREQEPLQLRHAPRHLARRHFPRVPGFVFGEQRRGLRDRTMADTPVLPRRTANIVDPLFDGAEWDFALIDKVYQTMGEIALGEMGSTSTPTRSRSSPPSRCSMPIPRSACR